MSKPKKQNRTFHLLQKADILTCYEQAIRMRRETSDHQRAGTSTLVLYRERDH